jgi:hypothetical protein
VAGVRRESEEPRPLITHHTKNNLKWITGLKGWEEEHGLCKASRGRCRTKPSDLGIGEDFLGKIKIISMVTLKNWQIGLYQNNILHVC